MMPTDLLFLKFSCQAVCLRPKQAEAKISASPAPRTYLGGIAEQMLAAHTAQRKGHVPGGLHRGPLPRAGRYLPVCVRRPNKGAKVWPGPIPSLRPQSVEKERLRLLACQNVFVDNHNTA